MQGAGAEINLAEQHPGQTDGGGRLTRTACVFHVPLVISNILWRVEYCLLTVSYGVRTELLLVAPKTSSPSDRAVASITVPQGLLSAIDQRARSLDMTRSQYVRFLARKDLECPPAPKPEKNGDEP